MFQALLTIALAATPGARAFYIDPFAGFGYGGFGYGGFG